MKHHRSRSCVHCGPQVQLEEVEFKECIVDRCQRCQGMYFDKGELESIFGLVDLYASVVLDEPEIDHVPDVEHFRNMPCPVDGALMNARSVGGVWLDICPTCSGIWVDGGEIAALKFAENQIKQNLNLYIRLGN